MSVTMRDVARASGVSVGTVSSVINNRNRIGAATRERVLAQIRALGYDPDRNLPRRPQVRKQNIGLVVPGSITEIHAAYYRAIMAAKQATAARGLGFSFHFEDEVGRMAVDRFHLGREQLGCDGLVIFAPRLDYDAYMKNLAAWDVPMVLVRRTTDLDGVTTIRDDDGIAMNLALKHLYDLGHRRIAYFTSWYGQDRIMETFCREHELRFTKDLVIERADIPSSEADRNRTVVPWDVTTEYYVKHTGLMAHMERLLAGPDAPTAVCCRTDYLAVEMVKSLQALGYDVPGDISVTGRNDNPAATLFEPRITTARMPTEEMIDAACGVLAGEGDGTDKELVLKNTLIVRESTDKVRDAGA